MRRRALAATIGFSAALAPLAAWACVPAYDTPPTTLAERFAEGAWMVEARITGLEPEASGFLRENPMEPMSRAEAQVEKVLWGSAPDKLRLRYWDEIFPAPYYWYCARYQPSFCEDVKPGDRLLILGEMDSEGQTALDCFIAPEEGALLPADLAPLAEAATESTPEKPDPADLPRKAAAFRNLAAQARERILRLEAEAKAATPAKAYGAAMALAEAWAEYGDHPSTDQAFRAAVALDPKRPDAWLRLARHRLEQPERAYRAYRAPPREPELRIGLETLEEYLAAHGEHARVRSLRDELAAALGEPLDLERTNLRGAVLRSPQPIPLKGAPPGLDASQSRAAFAAAGAKLVGARFREAQLEGGDFTGADLRRADLRGAQALGVSFRNADLRGADLAEADLHEADLRGAKLGWALLGAADLRGADLTGANLAAAFLPGANFYAARLSGTNLEFRDPENPLISLAGAFVDCATRLPKDFEPGRRGTIPLERTCDGADQIADLSELNSLDDSPNSILILEGLDLRGASFALAGLSRRVEARIARADLSGASFVGAKAYLFWGAGARGQAKLAGANFHRAEILFNLPGADLRGADFTGAHVTGLKKNFDLGEAKFTGAILDFSAAGYAEPADLDALMSKADFSGATLFCGLSARPAERRLWAALAERLAEEGLTPSPACAEALAWSAENP